MNKYMSFLYNEPIQLKIREFANHLLVVIAFFLPLNVGAVKSGFFILVTLLLLQKNLFTHIKIALLNRVVLSILALFLFHYIGISYSDDPARSLSYANQMKFLVYPIIIVILADFRFIPRIVSAFVLGVFLSEILSYGIFFEFITSLPPLLEGSPLISKYEPSPFTYHAEYGYILSITSAFIVHRLLTKTSITEKIILGLFLTTITMNVFLNSARTGYVLFVIANATVLVIHFKTQLFQKLFLILPTIIVLFSTVWLSSDNLQREFHETIASVSQILNGNYHSTLGTRIEFLRMGWTALQNGNPLIGLGTDMHGLSVYNQAVKENNTEIMRWLYSTVPLSGRIFFVDCEYNSFLLQFGFIGLLIYLNFFAQLYFYKQPDKTLHTMKNMLVLTSLFYAITSSLFSGYMIPILFIFISSITLISYDNKPNLSKINLNNLLFYTLGSVGLFTLSKIT